MKMNKTCCRQPIVTDAQVFGHLSDFFGKSLPPPSGEGHIHIVDFFIIRKNSAEEKLYVCRTRSFDV